LHGSLFDVKCSSEDCDYWTTNHSLEPIFSEPSREVIDLSGHEIRTDDIEIPCCPFCGYGLLRPGVVWLGEKLPPGYLERINTWFESVEHIGVIMVVGTEALVQPAASYIHRAAEKGARVMHFNKTTLRPDQQEEQEEMDEIDFFVQGDVAESLPSLIGYC
jgi:NAD-dependent SIR2 family protein deacetylase